MKLKILLINPPRVDGFPVVREERFEHKDIGSVYPPLSLLYMAAILEKNPGYDVKIIDANGFDISIKRLQAGMEEIRPDVVITRCGFDTQEQDLQVLKIAKNIGAVTILRNKIISDVPAIKDELLQRPEMDIFIDSEPDAVIENLIAKIHSTLKEEPSAAYSTGKKYGNRFDSASVKDVGGISFFSNGRAVTTPAVKDRENLDDIPFPAYHLLPNLDVYHTGVMKAPFALVATSRGCPFICTFCAYGKCGYRIRSAENVVTEIKWLKKEFKIKSFLFFDDTISLEEGRTEQIAGMMIAEGLSDLEWACCSRANLVNYEMLKIMKQAGMKEIAIGIETGSEKIQKNISKGVKLEDIRQCAKWCHELGILFYGLAIIGLPGETKETVEESVKFMKEIDPFYTQFCFATPFPNTDIYKYYKDNEYLLSQDWSKYFPLAEKPVARTEALAADDLKKLRRYAYSKMLFRPLYLLKQLRLFDWKWNIRGAVKITEMVWRLLTGKALR